ncbi:hypothetical protein MJ581_23690 [Escherichia coli]|nr:hypothetical protein MJ581_23690 [Escherichia coli]
MLKIIPGATGYFNKTLNSNQFDNEDAIKGKVNSIYGKNLLIIQRHRDIIIAKNRFVYSKRITHNLWTALKK